MATYSVPQEGMHARLPVNVSRTLMRATGRDWRRHKASRGSAGQKICPALPIVTPGTGKQLRTDFRFQRL
jgi:hypothetical protein